MRKSEYLGSVRDLRKRTILNIQKTVWGENDMKLALSLFFSAMMMPIIYYILTRNQNYMTEQLPIESLLLIAASVLVAGFVFLFVGLCRYMAKRYALREAEEIGLAITEVDTNLYNHFCKSLSKNRTKTIVRFFNLKIAIIPLALYIITFILISFILLSAMNLLCTKSFQLNQKKTLDIISSTLNGTNTVSLNNHRGYIRGRVDIDYCFNNDGKIYATNQNVTNKNIYYATLDYTSKSTEAIRRAHRNNRKYRKHFGTPDVLDVDIKITDKMYDAIREKKEFVQSFNIVRNNNRITEVIETYDGLVNVSLYYNNYKFRGRK